MAPAVMPRTVTVSREEGELLIVVVENIVAFAQGFPIEFNSYCPPERWQKTLQQVGGWTQEIERQLSRGQDSVAVPAEAIFRLVDIERCISAARDARLAAAKLSFTISAVGAIGSTILGITWLGMPAYLAGLAILLGRPLLTKYYAEPQEPYKPSLAGGDGCEAEPDLGDHTDKAKILERVIVASPVIQKHHWGYVRPSPGHLESAVCLSKGAFRVRVEGWTGDVVEPASGWTRVSIEKCTARKEIVVWEPCELAPRSTVFGPIVETSGHPETYWVEYMGPLTGGVCRRAGPFG